LISIFQEAIDNGDILENENEFLVVVHVLPLIDSGVLKPSVHVATLEARLSAQLQKAAQELRKKQKKSWWQLWK